MSRLIKVFEPLESKGTGRLTYKIQVVRLDSIDYQRLSRYKWYIRRDKNGRILQVFRTGGLNEQLRFGLNREVLGIKPGDPVRVRYINGDVLDCRRKNLVVRPLKKISSPCSSIG